MKDESDYDGIADSIRRTRNMFLELEMEYERQMWRRWKETNPDGFPFDKVLKNVEGIKGKVIIGTMDNDIDSQAKFLRELWSDSPEEKESGLYRFFRPAWGHETDEVGFKKDVHPLQFKREYLCEPPLKDKDDES